MPKTAKTKTKSSKRRVATDPKVRKITPPTYKSFRLSKRIKQPKLPLPGAFRLFRTSANILIKNWRLFGSIILIYAFLTLLLVKGLGVSNGLAELRDSFGELFNGKAGEVVSGFALLGILIGSAGSTTSQIASAYQSLLLVIMSLVFIWTLRHIQADAKQSVGVRDPFYKGLYPLIPFILVLMVVGLQTLPIVVANFLYTAVFVGGLATTAVEQVLWALLLFAMVLLSLYMITSSVFALYIVSLPDVRPMQALRSARELVRYRRWTIMRKVLFLPFVLLFLVALIIVPLIILQPTVAEWLFFVMSMVIIAIVHSYMYTLYRELLK